FFLVSPSSALDLLGPSLQIPARYSSRWALSAPVAVLATPDQVAAYPPPSCCRLRSQAGSPACCDSIHATLTAYPSVTAASTGWRGSCSCYPASFAGFSLCADFQKAYWLPVQSSDSMI